MTGHLLSLLCLLCLLCGNTQAKYCLHHETAAEDRAQARHELETLQAFRATGGEVRIMKLLIHSGKVEQEKLHASRALPTEDVQRIIDILQQVRPNPNYIRRTGGHKRIGKWTMYSSPELVLSFNGEWREFNIHAITSTGEMSDRWLLEDKLLEELRAIVERNAPKCPKI